MTLIVREILGSLAARRELSEHELTLLIAAIARDEVSDAQIAAFLMGLRQKGISAAEAAAISRAMRSQCLRVRPKVADKLLDTCGTGGGLSTFNISTAAAIVCAAAGIPVAKHGSRSLSNLSGSADVLEALGVVIDLPPSGVERMIEQVGIGFLHAPNFHPVMRRVLPVEAGLGIKTIFYTMIGPMISPAGAPRHLLGVYSPELLDIAADVARELGFERALLVHGEHGLDELSLLGPSEVRDLRDGEIHRYRVDPTDLGLAPCRIEDIRSLGPKGNADLLREVFAGRAQGPPRDAILLNSAAGLMAGGKVESLVEGLALARHLLDEGLVGRKLHDMVDASRALANPVALSMFSPYRAPERSRKTAPVESGPLADSLSHDIWNSLLAHSPEGLILLHPDCRVITANRVACEQVGAAPLTGRLYGDTQDQTFRELMQQELANALQQAQPRSWELAAGPRQLVFTALPLSGASAVLLLVRDVTPLRRLEESEQNKRARLKTLIETLPDLIWLKDVNGRYVNCNRRFESFIGLREQELKGRTDYGILPTALADALAASAAQSLRDGRSVLSQAWLTYASDKHSEFAEIIHTPFIDDRGVLRGVMGIARDVTAYKQNEEELRRHRDQLEQLVAERTDKLSRTIAQLAQAQNSLIESERLASLGTMVAGVSHELNTPIGNVVTVASTAMELQVQFSKLAAQGSLRRSALNEHLTQSHEMLELIYRSARRAAELVESFKQVAIDQTSEHRRRFDLREVVAATVAPLLPNLTLQCPRLEIIQDVPPGLACDSYPGPLGQILSNLLQNAMLHAFKGREQGQISISATLDQEQIRLRVNDNGCGMSDATLIHIFDPFFTTTLGQGGSGLGLPISRRLAAGVLGGSLSAASQPQRGSCFTLLFPRTAPGGRFVS